MTYLEIIEWIENRVISICMPKSDVLVVDYHFKGGISSKEGKDLISIVLEINDKELIK